MGKTKKYFQLKFYPLPFIIFSAIIIIFSCILIAFPPVIVTSNKLNNEMLEEYNFDGFDNLMIVAHPGDETIWAGNELLNNKYVVLCLTNGDKKDSAEEFNNAIKFSGNIGIILSYPDLNYSLIQNNWESVMKYAEIDINLILKIKTWNKVVTHNPDGEYGHNHHKKTSQIVSKVAMETNIFKDLYYFAKYFEKQNLSTVNKVLSNTENVKKNEMLQLYLGTQNRSVKAFKYITAYESFIKADKWI